MTPPAHGADGVRHVRAVLRAAIGTFRLLGGKFLACMTCLHAAVQIQEIYRESA